MQWCKINFLISKGKSTVLERNKTKATLKTWRTNIKCWGSMSGMQDTHYCDVSSSGCGLPLPEALLFESRRLSVLGWFLSFLLLCQSSWHLYPREVFAVVPLQSTQILFNVAILFINTFTHLNFQPDFWGGNWKVFKLVHSAFHNSHRKIWLRISWKCPYYSLSEVLS